jgi:hypothetical protein
VERFCCHSAKAAEIKVRSPWWREQGENYYKRLNSGAQSSMCCCHSVAEREVGLHYGTFQKRHWVAGRQPLRPSSGWDTSLYLDHGTTRQSHKTSSHKPQQCLLSHGFAGRCRHGGEQVSVTSDIRVSCQANSVSVAQTPVAHSGPCEG